MVFMEGIAWKAECDDLDDLAKASSSARASCQKPAVAAAMTTIIKLKEIIFWNAAFFMNRLCLGMILAVIRSLLKVNVIITNTENSCQHKI